jgi:CheY-like chemotaxis protein
VRSRSVSRLGPLQAFEELRVIRAAANQTGPVDASLLGRGRRRIPPTRATREISLRPARRYPNPQGLDITTVDITACQTSVTDHGSITDHNVTPWPARGPRGKGATMAGSGASDAIRVLLVEDDVEFAEMYRLRLEADEYVVKWACNGEEGLGLAHSWDPQLIFLDMRMPEMDGLELLRILRADPATAGVPVVVLTNYDDQRLQRKMEGLGILEWRSKIDTTPGGMSASIKRWASAESGESETP